MPEDENLTDVQPTMTRAGERVAYFEKRMNYKCKGLTPEQKEEFDLKFYNSTRMRKWVG